METEGREVEVKHFFQRHDIWSKMLSVMIAIALWGFVVNEEDSLERTVRYTIPVTLSGQQQLLQEHSMAVIAGQDSKVVLTVTGTNPNIIKLTADDFTVTVDVSDLTEAKTYSNVPYQVSLPATSPSLQLKSSQPSNVTLTTDVMTTKEVPVQAVCAESAPEGYLYATPSVSKDTLEVYGPESVLQTIEDAYVSVPMNNATTDVSEDCVFELQDAEGKPVDTTYLQTEETSVQANVNVYKIATVPLKVTLKPSAQITEDMATVTIDPVSVQVYGKKSVIDNLESIAVGALDLGSEQTGAQITKPILLPSGVYLMSGQPSQAKITLQIDGIATRTVNISNITLVDINANETKPDIALGTQSVQVTLRGKTSSLNALSVDDILVSAQFDSSVLGAGTHDVALSVSVKTSEVTIVEHTKVAQVIISDGTNPIAVDGVPQNDIPITDVQPAEDANAASENQGIETEAVQ